MVRQKAKMAALQEKVKQLEEAASTDNSHNSRRLKELSMERGEEKKQEQTLPNRLDTWTHVCLQSSRDEQPSG